MDHIYTFPIDNLDSSTTIQLILKIQFAPSGSDVNFTASTENVWVNAYGRLKWEYNFDDQFVTPGTLSLQIADPDEKLSVYFFDRSGTYTNVEIHNSRVELNLGGSLEFSGTIIADTVDFDQGTKLLSFSVASVSEVINNQVLILDDNTAVNPFSYTNNSSVGTNAGTDPLFTEVIKNIFELVNSSIALRFYHTWQFKTVNSDPSYNVPLTALHYNPFEIAFWTARTPKTAGDLLRRLAFDFHCYSGLINRDNAFFKQLFVYESGYTFTPDVLDIKRRIAYPHYEFIRIETGDGSDEEQAERGVEANAGVGSKFVKADSNLYTFTEVGFGYFSTLWEDTPPDEVLGIDDPENGFNRDKHIDLLADNINNWRKFHRLNHLVTEYKLNGVSGIDINRDFTYNSIEHNTLFVEKNFDEVTTIVHGIELR